MKSDLLNNMTKSEINWISSTKNGRIQSYVCLKVMLVSVFDLDVYETVKRTEFEDKFKTHLQKWQMTGLSKTFNVVTDDCNEVIFHKISLGAFHTSMFTRTVAITEDFSFLTGKIHNKNKATFLKSTLPYHLESQTHIYHAS